MQQASTQNATETMLADLVGDDCNWCPTGSLTRDEFRGDAAVVCETCETPAVRVW